MYARSKNFIENGGVILFSYTYICFFQLHRMYDDNEHKEDNHWRILLSCTVVQRRYDDDDEDDNGGFYSVHTLCKAERKR